jgi:hypothetical protein
VCAARSDFSPWFPSIAVRFVLKSRAPHLFYLYLSTLRYFTVYSMVIAPLLFFLFFCMWSLFFLLVSPSVCSMISELTVVR